MTEEFPRIGIGIGKSARDEDLAGYMLSEFSKSELEGYQITFKYATLLIENFVIGGNKKMLEANSVLIKSENNSTKNI